MRRSSSESSPLSHERLAILLALAREPAMAMQVYDQIVGDSVGRISLKRSSLHQLLHQLKREEYIVDGPVYDLTAKGWQVLESEQHRVKRYSQLLTQRLSPRQYKASMPAD